jgi:H+/gluconate symporter-like permease
VATDLAVAFRFAMWTGDDTLLVIYAVIGVAVIVGLILALGTMLGKLLGESGQ